MKRSTTARWIILGFVILGSMILVGATSLLKSRKEAHQASLEDAYEGLVGKARSTNLSGRRYQLQGFGTDQVERFRFDGASQLLVEELIQRFSLQQAPQPLESDWPAPSWWQLPEDADTYVNGASYQYRMMIRDRNTGRVFLEDSSD